MLEYSLSVGCEDWYMNQGDNVLTVCLLPAVLSCEDWYMNQGDNDYAR